MTRGFLLDTNILSEFMRPRPAEKVLAFMAAWDASRLYVTDVTLAELCFGASLVDDPVRRSGILAAIDERIRPQFEGRTLSADEATWLVWKRLEWQGRKRRYTHPQPDLVIAALASQHGLTVATRDTEPFREAGVAVFNPWEG